MTNDQNHQGNHSALETTLRFEEIMGLSFNDKTLLQRALTHRSFLNETSEFLLSDNERLEFLGDAVLDFVVGEYLYHRYPEKREGALTNLRASLVCQKTLAQFARQLDLGNHILLGRGEASTGGRQRPAILCAGFEALIGALFLDQELKAVKDLLFPLVEPVLPSLAIEAEAKDAKSRFQEWSQAQLRATPHYETIAEEGPDHAKVFTVQVFLGDVVYGAGQGQSKQKAAQAAAAEALQRTREAEKAGEVPVAAS